MTSLSWNELLVTWKELIRNRKVYVSDKVAIASLLCGLSASLHKHGFVIDFDGVNEDLRFHFCYFADPRSGKGEIINVINEVFRDFILIDTPTSISDAIQIGSVDNKNGVVEGIYKMYDLVVHDECQNIFESRDWGRDILANIRKNCDRFGTSSNFMKNSKIKNSKLQGFYGTSTIMLSSFLILDEIKKALGTGTLERFHIQYEKTTREKSRKIFETLKISNNTLSKQAELEFKKIVSTIILTPRKITFNPEDFNALIDELNTTVETYYDDETDEVARRKRGFVIGALLQIKKMAAIITICDQKNTVGKEELSMAKDFILENLLHLGNSLGIFQNRDLEDFKDEFENDKGNEFTKTQINERMAKRWNIVDIKTVVRRLKAIIPVATTVRKDGNTQYHKIK